jgi:DNA-binding IclR family transcriptional regulator
MVPAVVKAFRLLDILSASNEPLGVSELARRLGMGKSTIHGLVTTLQYFGAIEAVEGTKRYRLGPGLHALAMRAAGKADLRQRARPVLERLVEATGQTSFLGVVGDDEIAIIDVVHGKPAMSVSARIGSTIPLLAGAVGKAVLAAWDEARRDAFLRRTELPKFTPHTIVDPAKYARVVEETRERGAALDIDEYVDGVRAAAAPIVGGDHQLQGVLWIAGFARHIDDAALRFAADMVAQQARELGRGL